MRIAFFTDDYLPFVHGVVTSIQNYRQAFEALGHQVHVVAPRHRNQDGADDHLIKLPAVNPRIFEDRPLPVHHPALVRRFDRYDFDIVHSHTQGYAGMLGHRVARRRGIPHVTTVHTHFGELIDVYPLATAAGILVFSVAMPLMLRTRPVLPRRLAGMGLRQRQTWRLVAAFANETDAVVSPSAHLARALPAYGVTAPCHVIPNGVPLHRYRAGGNRPAPVRKGQGERHILCVGRLSREKRVDVLIDAMRQVRHPGTRLVVVGTGPGESALRALARGAGVGDRVLFTGYQEPAAVAALLRQADVFAHPSYHFDNQPMVILEAIASGLPVVYCDERLAEGLTPGNAVLTRAPDGAAFAAALDDLLADPRRRAAMAKRSQAVAEEFDVLVLARRMTALYLRSEQMRRGI
jgi:1,2-diacylglycerol 3-alpha-glucosyltransferase